MYGSVHVVDVVVPMTFCTACSVYSVHWGDVSTVRTYGLGLSNPIKETIWKLKILHKFQLWNSSKKILVFIKNAENENIEQKKNTYLIAIYLKSNISMKSVF